MHFLTLTRCEVMPNRVATLSCILSFHKFKFCSGDILSPGLNLRFVLCVFVAVSTYLTTSRGPPVKATCRSCAFVDALCTHGRGCVACCRVGRGVGSIVVAYLLTPNAHRFTSKELQGCSLVQWQQHLKCLTRTKVLHQDYQYYNLSSATLTGFVPFLCHLVVSPLGNLM